MEEGLNRRKAVGSGRIPRSLFSLLEADRMHAERTEHRRVILGVAVALSNLFLCGYFDSLIQNDTADRSFLLFVALQSSMYLFFSFAHYINSSDEIIRNISVFPSDAAARMAFVAFSNLRTPVIISLWGTNIFFFLFLYHSSVGIALLGLSSIVLLLVCIELLSTVCMLLTRRFHQSGQVLVVALIFGLFATGSLALVFDFDSLLKGVPLVAWVASAMTAFQSGLYPESAGSLSLMILSILFLVMLGKEYS